LSNDFQIGHRSRGLNRRARSGFANVAGDKISRQYRTFSKYFAGFEKHFGRFIRRSILISNISCLETISSPFNACTPTRLIAARFGSRVRALDNSEGSAERLLPKRRNLGRLMVAPPIRAPCGSCRAVVERPRRKKSGLSVHSPWV